MAVSVQQRVQYAYAAGFRNTSTIEALTIIVAISLCECGPGSASGCETGCNPDCCPPAPSCGLLQVYQPAHPGTAACASDPACVFTLGWSISNHGTSFSPWSTYNDGCFRQHLDTVRAAIAGLSLGGSPPPPPVSTCPPGWGLDADGICAPPVGSPPPPSTPPPVPSGAGSLGLAVLLIGGAIAISGWRWERDHPGSLRGLEERLAGDPSAAQTFARGGPVGGAAIVNRTALPTAEVQRVVQTALGPRLARDPTLHVVVAPARGSRSDSDVTENARGDVTMRLQLQPADYFPADFAGAGYRPMGADTWRDRLFFLAAHERSHIEFHRAARDHEDTEERADRVALRRLATFRRA